MTSEKGSEIINSGWRAACITYASHLGLHNVSSIDPFAEIDLIN